MKNFIINFSDSDRIAHALMLRSFFEPDLGLFKGKMGIVLALGEYSRKKENKIFVDFSFDLLEIIISKINKQLAFSLSNGLSGIGWGIEYLIQNEFVEGSSIDICEEIDQKIMETDPKRIWDMSLEDGFEGLLHYIFFHIQGACKQQTNLPFDSIYLSDIYNVCMRLKEKNIKKSLKFLLNAYIAFVDNNTLANYATNIFDFAFTVPNFQINELATYPLGLNEGLSGVLLHLIDKNET